LEEAPSDVPGDEESASIEEDMDEEQQREQVFESFEKPTLNAEALLPMSKDVDIMEAAVSNEPISNITEHEENDNVSLH
jgi:hypothetical protein